MAEPNGREAGRAEDGVSVVMATYNGGPFIAEQLNSIALQTRPPDEIVVCDDGSSDDTLAVVEGFARRSPCPVRLHRNPVRLGYADNFLHAASLARFRYLCFADQDDVWYPTKIERSLGHLVGTGALLCAHKVRMVDEDLKPIAVAHQEIAATGVHEPGTLDPWGVFLGFSTTIDRRLLDIIPAGARGLDSHTFAKVSSHDRWMYFLGTHFGRVAVIEDCLADYRQHTSNSYGIVRKTLLDRFRTKMGEGAPRLLLFRDLAAFRVDMLRAARHPDHEPHFAAAIARWERIRDHCARRHRLYSQASLARRGGTLLKGLTEGTYRGFPAGGLGPKRLLEDVSLGLFGKVFMP